MELLEMQEAIHGNAIEKGWWPGDRSWAECRILIVSEVAEALEEFRAGRMEVWGAMIGKPEGFGVELADAAIRILDWRGRHGSILIDDTDYDSVMVGRRVPEQLDLIVDVLYAYDDDSHLAACAEAIAVISSVAKANGVDLSNLVRLKHEYNKTRPYRHGGKEA